MIEQAGGLVEIQELELQMELSSGGLAQYSQCSECHGPIPQNKTKAGLCLSSLRQGLGEPILQ